METNAAVTALAALAQPTRLNAFRALVQAGPNGMAQGELARVLDVQPATLSFHLQQLDQAGLVQRRRHSRHIYYAADFEGMRRLLAFLGEDCCAGRPEICGDLARLANQCAPDAGESK